MTETTWPIRVIEKMTWTDSSVKTTVHGIRVMEASNVENA